MAIIGKNVIENLTTAMYEDLRIIYREYVQNAADSIDKAIKQGLLRPEEARIEINIDADKRYVSVQDNGTGISCDDFLRKMSRIADSEKDRAEDKGFRGIGRLGGISSCKILKFSCSVRGEQTVSVCVWDAQQVRDILVDEKQNPSAGELVDMVTTYSQDVCDIDEHFFLVELIDIEQSSAELLDKDNVQKYLEAVRPLFYDTFYTIYHRANEYKKALQKQSELQATQQEHEQRMASGGFIDAEDQAASEKKIEELKKAAERAAKTIETREQKEATDQVLGRVYSALRSDYAPSDDESGEETPPQSKPCSEKPKGYMTQSLSKYNRKEQKLISRIYSILKAILPHDTAEIVISKIQEDANMKKLAEIPIRPVRIAFDHWELHDVYENAVRTAVRNGHRNLSNYILYNFEDRPVELYLRLKLNVDLCEELGASIYSFPMKYHPIEDPEYFDNRDFIGKHWNRKFIRTIQAVLNSTKGKVGRGHDFFCKAFGANEQEYFKLLYMPEAMIIYRFFFEGIGLTDQWWAAFSALSDEEMDIARPIIEKNVFTDIQDETDNDNVLNVLRYYCITRDDAERMMENP